MTKQKKIVYLIVLLFLIIIGALFTWLILQNSGHVGKEITTVLISPTPTPLVIDYDTVLTNQSDQYNPTFDRLATAAAILNWATLRRDYRGAYLYSDLCQWEGERVVCTINRDGASNNRLGGPAIWARYNYWLATADEKELKRLTDDLIAYQTIANGDDWLIQSNLLNCWYLLPVVTSDKLAITETMKQAARDICIHSNDESNAWYDHNDYYEYGALSDDEYQVLIDTYQEQINQKLQLLLADNWNYDLENDELIKIYQDNLHRQDVQWIFTDWSKYTIDAAARLQLVATEDKAKTKMVLYRLYSGALSNIFYQYQNGQELSTLTLSYLATATKTMQNNLNNPLLSQYLQMIQTQLATSVIAENNNLSEQVVEMALNDYILHQEDYQADSNRFLNLLINYYQKNLDSIYQGGAHVLLLRNILQNHLVKDNLVFAGLLTIGSK